MSGRINFTIREIMLATGGSFTGDCTLLDEKITTVKIDSRKVDMGGVFVAIKGEKTDGYNYIPAAIEKGALCVISDRAYEGYPCVVVKDAVTALQDMARAYRKKLNITVIGITGSVGKTTTKEIVASVLKEKYSVVKTEGNFNNGLGLPLTVMSIKPDTQVAVIEMGMNHFGEMELLSSIALPTMCIMTNIGISHIENLGSRENILKAKSEVFSHMSATARCIFNGDDDLLRTLDRPNRCYYGFDLRNDIFIESFYEHGFDGTDFEASVFGEKYNCSITVPGRHVLFAAMAAMAAGSWLGLTHQQIVDGLSSAKALSGRTNVIHTEKYTLIDDCYNAAPQSMISGIDLLIKSDDHERSVCVFGDMGELGEDEKYLHKSVGEYAAKSKVGLLIAIGPLSKEIFRGALENGGNAMWFETKEEFLKEKQNILKDGDAILIKASHFMDFSKIVEELKN
ncbi:MAG: UDP-N-acetylmuramoyl-tripeptide--D-alanyl-D-alanine ligase [Clostridia bacterium]|nr:UDP-N-acetylmuramoyl-tripeptide--D-alanyl-D-alanine ligase [Clostridia bacterium]